MCVCVCVLLHIHRGLCTSLLFCDLIHQVIATHLYHGEDEDELTFEKGAIVYVVPYEDAEDEASLYMIKCRIFARK